MIRVLNVMLSKGYGGLEEVFLKFAKDLQNHEIKVYNISRFDSYCSKALYNFSIGNSCVKGGNFLDFKSRKEIKNFVKKHNIDIIIAHGRRAIYHVMKSKSDCKIISFLHTPTGFGLNEIFKSDLIFILNNEQRTRLIKNKFPSDKIIKIPNYIEEDFFKNYQSKPIKNNYFSIGMLCRLDKIKGIDIFLKAISIIQHKGYKCDVLIGGEGSEKANLIKLSKKLAIKNIFWLGFVNRESFFRDLNIFVNQSHYETFGLSTIEAMASGCYVVATKTAGSFEIITDKVDGFLVDVNSVDSTVRTIEQIIKSNDANVQINAFNKVKDNFSSSIILGKIREIILNIDSL